MLNRRQFLATAAAVLASATGCATLKQALPTRDEPDPALLTDEGPRPSLRVALLSDPHTESAHSPLVGAINDKLAQAVKDYKPLCPDLWLVNGDIANDGQAAQIDAFKQIMARVAKPEQLLVTTGNHDFYDKEASDEEELRRFREAFGLKTPYSNRVAGGIHFVMLADEQYKSAPRYREWAWLSPEQLRWFEQVLTANRDKFTVVCLHQPLQDTITWTWGGNDFAGCGQVKELRAIMQKHPQIRLWLSGHTHMGAAVPGNFARKGGMNYVGLGSTFYLFVPDDGPAGKEYGGFRKDLSASQSHLMEVWPDRVVLRARDHVRQAWMDEQEIVIKRS